MRPWIFDEGRRLMPRTLRTFLVRLYSWLACADSTANGDLIFVLAGRKSRKVCGLEMFSQGRAPQLLLSVGRFELRRFADLPFPVQLNLPRRAASVSPPQRHIFVYLDKTKSAVEFVAKGRFGTLSEIRALKEWVGAHSEVKSVLIVSSAFHLRRVRLCCRSVLPTSIQCHLLAVDEGGVWLRRDLWWQSSRTRAIVLRELPKLLVYWLVLHFQSATGNVAYWLRSWNEAIAVKRRRLT